MNFDYHEDMLHQFIPEDFFGEWKLCPPMRAHLISKFRERMNSVLNRIEKCPDEHIKEYLELYDYMRELASHAWFRPYMKEHLEGLIDIHRQYLEKEEQGK